MPGWNQPGFDDSNWSATKIATKDSINTKCDIENIDLIAQIDQPVAVTQELEVKEITEPKPGVYIFDLGQNMVGWVRLKVKGPEGTKIRLRYGEMLYDEKAGENEGMLYTENLRSAKATDYYILKGDSSGEVYEPRFTFHGFRYVEVTGYPGVPSKDDITGIVVGSALDQVGHYETSNPLLNQLYSNIVWGQKGNYLSIPTDCPQRDERLGWTGDAQIFCRTATFNMDVNQFFKKYLLDVKTAQRDNGAIYDVAPAIEGLGEGNAGWGDVAVIAPWTMYITYGDTQIIKDNYQMMKDWIEYYKDYAERTEPGKLIIPDCAYGDWLSIGESTPKNVVATAYFAYSTDLFSKMARAIGEYQDAEEYEQLFLDIREDFNERFVSDDGRIEGNSQTAYLLVLRMNLLPTEQLREKAVEHLIERIRLNNWHLTTGFLGVGYLCPVLSDVGYSDVAYRLLLNETYPSWLYSVVNGATTIWERWNSYTKEDGFGPVSMNSFNHYAYGSVGEWMFRYSAGIEADADNPGYKHVIIQPEPTEHLSYVKASYDSVYGMIESNWELDDDEDKFTLNVKIPANTTATVYMPSDKADKIKVDGMSYIIGETQIEGVTYVGRENGKEIFNIESGSYIFESSILDKYDLSIQTDDEYVLGDVEINGDINRLPYSRAFKEGEEIAVKSIPTNDIDYKFYKWDEYNTTNNNPLTITMDKDINLKAKFSYIGNANLAIGKTVTSKTSDGASPVWSRENLTDGIYISTGLIDEGIKGYTSSLHDEQDISDNAEWVEIDLGTDIDFNKIQLYPRTDVTTKDGSVAGFPQDFTISVKKDGESDYTMVYNAENCKAPDWKPMVIDIGEQNARYIRLTATKLGDRAIDDVGYRLQLAEIGVYNVKDKASYTLTIDKIGEGSILLNGEEITLPYTATYPAGSDITLKAVEPSFITEFKKWSGTYNSFSKELNIVLNDDHSFIANFDSLTNTNFALNKPATSNDSITVPGAWDVGRLTDGQTKGTGYSSNGSANPDVGEDGAKWISVDLEENHLIDTIVLYPRTDGTLDENGKTPNYPVNFEIQIKAEGDDDYTTVKTLKDQPNPEGLPQTYQLDTPVLAKEVRIFVTKLGSKDPQDLGGYRLQLAEMEIYNKKYIQDIEITSDDELEIGSSKNISIQALLSDGSTLDVNMLPKTIISSEEKVATVTNEGIITPVSAGSTTITVNIQINGIEYTCMQELTVLNKITEIILSSDKQTLKRTQQAQAEVKVKLEGQDELVDVSTLDGASVEYFSNNPEIASIDQNGVITANAIGQTEIKATVIYNESTIESEPITITVEAKDMEAVPVKLEYEKDIIEIGDNMDVVVKVEQAEELYAANFRINYDPEVFEIENVALDPALGTEGEDVSLTYTDQDGLLNVIVTLLGDRQPIEGDADIIHITLKAKDKDSATEIKIQKESSIGNIHGEMTELEEEVVASIAVANADVTGGGIAINDLVIVARAFGKTDKDAGYEARLDMNKDGVIDIMDIAYVAKKVLNN